MEPLHERDPSTIGPYKVIAHLGSGGMGRVFLAQHAGASVAIKILSAGASRSPDMRTRFEREVSALKKIRSPFVPAIVDSDVLADEVWFAVEFVNGTGLDELSEEQRLLTEREWTETLIGSLLALASVHDLDIIHRDIKPGNILLSGRGPQLIDFGIAQSPNETSLTRTGVFAGSPAWLSPDVFLEDDVTHKADVFSLASTMVFALTGESPWGPTSTRVPQMIKRLNEDPPSLEQVPNQYKALLTRMLDKDPSTRPSARECLADAWELAQDTSRERVRWWVRLARGEGRDIPTDTSALLRLNETEESERLIFQAQEHAKSIRQEATLEAQQKAEEIVSAAQEQSRNIHEQAEKRARSRHKEAEKALLEAKEKAEAITAKAERLARKSSRRAQSRRHTDTEASEKPGRADPRFSTPSAAIGAAAATVLAVAAGLIWTGLDVTATTSDEEVASNSSLVTDGQDASDNSEAQSSLPIRRPADIYPENGTSVAVGAPVRIRLDPRNEPIGTVEPVRAKLTALEGTAFQTSCAEEFSLPFDSWTKDFERNCTFDAEAIYRLEIWWVIGGTPSAGDWSNQYKSLITSFRVLSPEDMPAGPSWPAAEPLETLGRGDYMAHHLAASGRNVRVVSWLHPERTIQPSEVYFSLGPDLGGTCGSRVDLKPVNGVEREGFAGVWIGECSLESVADSTREDLNIVFSTRYPGLNHSANIPAVFGNTYAPWTTDWELVNRSLGF